MKRFRDAVTGLFVSKDEATVHPDTTVAETVSDATEVEGRLRWRCADLEVAMAQAAAAVRRLPMPASPASAERIATELERVAKATISEERA
jgi:hypothetical protein